MSDLKEINNSLTSLVSGLYQGGAIGAYGGSQLSQTDTMFKNNRWYLISNYRQLLSEMYIEHGIVQTLVDQPVDDAFSRGYTIKSGELDADDIEKLEVYLERSRFIETLKTALKWSRLYGGGAILIVDEDKPDTPFDITKLNEKSNIELKAVDLWELYQLNAGVVLDVYSEDKLPDGGDFFHYYGKRVHKSRVYRVEGKEAPAFIRPRLRGWGLSVMEKVVRSLNQYLKNQDVIFELLDEAKVDVYKITGFNSALMTAGGTAKVSNRIQAGNMIKNFNHAVTMDKEDDYEQKQISFSGMAEILVQIRQGIAADLRMPVTKLFGISSAGFNSGEDDIENYNAMIESEIRSKVKYITVDLIGLACQKLFGFIPEDLQIEFKSLRILSAKEEEDVKDRKFNRVQSALQIGGISTDEYKQAINKDSLLPVEIDEKTELNDPIDGDFTTKEGGADGS